jgi:hypothetical protein
MDFYVKTLLFVRFYPSKKAKFFNAWSAAGRCFKARSIKIFERFERGCRAGIPVI